jgi:phenylacetate-coenzyme A ligase PaaK-like adenylate-forming protein
MAFFQAIGFAVRSIQSKGLAGALPEHIVRIQTRRLRRLIGRAVERVPFYRERYRGIDAEHFELAELPPTNKAELMGEFDRTVSDPHIRRTALEDFIEEPDNLGRLFLGRYAVSHTSGSQGQRMLLVQEPWHVRLLFVLQASRGNASSEPPFLQAADRLLFRERLAVINMRPGFYPSAAAFAYMPPGARAFIEAQRFDSGDPNLVGKLNAFRPNAITAYAHVLERLALQADRLELCPDLRQVVNNSEALSERARARIEQAFGTPLLDNYATGECPFLSNGCMAGPGMHVNADWAILEVVDAGYRPVPPGQPGKKVLVTNLANTVQPIIRYEIGDVLAMADQPCRCGSRMPRIAHVEGRTAEEFWVLDQGELRTVADTIFKNACDYLREVREWQAVQEERNRIRLRLELLPGMRFNEAATRRIVTGQLREFGLPEDVVVEVEAVPALTPDPATGKFRRMETPSRTLRQPIPTRV